MLIDEPTYGLLEALNNSDIEFIIVGNTAAVLQGAPIMTHDLDIVHLRTPQNIERLLALLLSLGAYHRLDLANHRLPPRQDALSGTGHLNLATRFGPLDVLCELAEGEGYEQLVADTCLVTVNQLTLRVLSLERLIQVKAAAGRPKDRAVLPILVAALEEQRKRNLGK